MSLDEGVSFEVEGAPFSADVSDDVSFEAPDLEESPDGFFA